MTVKLPPKTRALVNRYLHLKVKDQILPCPYYENIQRKFGRAVFEGKGTPHELEIEASKLFSVSEKPTPKEIKERMIKANLGIDCSGLAMRVINAFLLEKYGTNIQKALQPIDKSFLGLLRFYLRPYTNISADMITSQENTKKINNYNDVLPGDLIRAGKKHVGIITAVEKESKQTKKIFYVHSLSESKLRTGVRQGRIIITKPQLELTNQTWEEKHKKGTMKTEYDLASETDRGIRRIKFIENS